MNELKDGGPAFPGTEDNYKFEGSAGMSLRDYFAAKAMQALITTVLDNVSSIDPVDAAEDAYLFADALLAARDSVRTK